MMDKKNIFSKDIEIPEIVMQKAEDAFAQIRLEGENNMTENNKMNGKKQKKAKSGIKKGMAAAACVGFLMVSSVTAAAAVYHFWGRGMQGNFQASKEQQQELIDQGYAKVMEEEENYEKLAVTVGNVTVKPVTVITDGKFAYLSFAVDGYSIGENIEPAFEFVNAYLGDNPDAGGVNMNGSFYDGIVSDETGTPVYDDGTPLAFDESGNYISHYADENGTLEYVITLFPSNTDASLLGETVHVDFSNLGNTYKAGFTRDLEGEWNFEINLSGESAAKKIQVGKAVEGTVFTVDSIEISPVSIKVNYSVSGEVTVIDDENGVPRFCGVVLKDGTKLPYLGDGGMTGYEDENMTKAFVMSTFDRVIEPEEVEAILLQPEAGADYYTVELGTNAGK